MIKEVMKACSRTVTIEDLSNLRYPLYASRKEDGIRMHTACVNGKNRGFSRKNIEIPNCYVQEWVEENCPANLDGELVIPGLSFNDNQSFFMSEFPLPQPWEFRVFDHTGYLTHTYLQRLQILTTTCARYRDERLRLIEVERVDEDMDIERFYARAIRKNWEGLILRSPDGLYKQGRATWKEGTMYKMKSWEEAEATIVGFEPEYENRNLQVRDNTGAAKRSSHNENLKERSCLGAFIVTSSGKDRFRIGSGFNRHQKIKFWKNRNNLIGRAVTYKFQPHGTKEKPRTPIFKGIRLD